MAQVSRNVLVIGGGIGGMAAAIALAKQGAQVEIVEKGPEWKVYGAGLTITGPTLRAFRDLGLLDAISEHGAFANGGHIYLFDGTLLTESATPPIEEGLPASGGIMRPKLHEIMTGEVAKLGIEVKFPVIANEFDQTGDQVQVSFSDGTTGCYDLVVGADGIYSDTRKQLFGDRAGLTYTGQMSWRVVAPRPEGMDVAHFFFGHHNIGGIIPCSDDEVYAFVLNPEPNPKRVAEEDKADVLRELLKDFGGTLGDIRDGIGPHSSIVQRPFEYVFQPRPWHQGRIVLIGDAAHATTPHLASGAGMAVEDALVLADELQNHDWNVSDALEAFTERRYDRCKFIVDESTAISQRQLEGAPPDEVGMRMGRAMHRLAEPI